MVNDRNETLIQIWVWNLDVGNSTNFKIQEHRWPRNRNFEKSHNRRVGRVEPENFTNEACDTSEYLFSRTQSMNPALFCILDSRGGGAGRGTYVWGEFSSKIDNWNAIHGLIIVEIYSCTPSETKIRILENFWYLEGRGAVGNMKNCIILACSLSWGLSRERPYCPTEFAPPVSVLCFLRSTNHRSHPHSYGVWPPGRRSSSPSSTRYFTKKNVFFQVAILSSYNMTKIP